MFSLLVFVIMNAIVVRFFSLSMFERGLLVVVNGDLASKLYASFYDPVSGVYTGDSSKPPAITSATMELESTATTAMSFAQLVVFNKTCSSSDIPYFVDLSASVFGSAAIEDQPS